MMLSNGYYHWKKGENISLSPHFSSVEFACRCTYPSCVKQRIAKELVDKIEATRLQVNLPMLVTSGYRCDKKQLSLRANSYETAKGVSQHELGNAADIFCTDIAKLGAYLALRFQALGTAKNFIHVDLRVDKPRRWSYYHV